MLGVRRVAGQSLLDLLVDDDIDLHPSLGSPPDGLVEPPFLAKIWRSTKEELGGQPPVLDVDRFFGVLDAYRYSPEVVSAIDIPFDLVVLTFGEEGLEAVAVTQSGTLPVGLLLMFFVMAMVGVKKITELSYLVLEMKCFNFGVIQRLICVAVNVKKSHRREHVPFSLSRRPFMLACFHEL